MTDCSTRVCVGTDIESIDDVATALERYGDRYARRLFTDYEIAICGGTVAAAAPRLAARFAAKEAVMKLLSAVESPTQVVPRWRSIEVRTAANGAPSIQLDSEAADLAREQGMGPLSLSMSHGAGIGMATVVALSTIDRG